MSDLHKRITDALGGHRGNAADDPHFVACSCGTWELPTSEPNLVEQWDSHLADVLIRELPLNRESKTVKRPPRFGGLYRKCRYVTNWEAE